MSGYGAMRAVLAQPWRFACSRRRSLIGGKDRASTCGGGEFAVRVAAGAPGDTTITSRQRSALSNSIVGPASKQRVTARRSKIHVLNGAPTLKRVATS